MSPLEGLSDAVIRHANPAPNPSPKRQGGEQDAAELRHPPRSHSLLLISAKSSPQCYGEPSWGRPNADKTRTVSDKRYSRGKRVKIVSGWGIGARPPSFRFAKSARLARPAPAKTARFVPGLRKARSISAWPSW